MRPVMSEPEDPIDRLLRRAAGDPTPDAADRAAAWEIYLRGVSQPRSGRFPARGFPRLVTALAATMVLAVGALVATRPSAAQAALLEIAEAAQLAEPLTIPSGQYAYTRSVGVNLGVTVVPFDSPTGERIAYLLPTERQMWTSATGVVQLISTVDEPIFFTATAETAYYAAGIDAIDRVGQTNTQTFTNATTILSERNWPTDPADLRETIEALLPAGYERPIEVEILDIALDLLREAGPEPALRAAAVAVIASLDSTVVEVSDGAPTFAISYTQPEAATVTFTINGQGHLLAEAMIDRDGDPSLNIPPGTIVSEVEYQPTLIVHSLAEAG